MPKTFINKGLKIYVLVLGRHSDRYPSGKVTLPVEPKLSYLKKFSIASSRESK